MQLQKVFEKLICCEQSAYNYWESIYRRKRKTYSGCLRILPAWKLRWEFALSWFWKITFNLVEYNFTSYCIRKFWIYWMGVNTKFTIWQLIVNFVFTPTKQIQNLQYDIYFKTFEDKKCLRNINARLVQNSKGIYIYNEFNQLFSANYYNKFGNYQAKGSLNIERTMLSLTLRPQKQWR
mgnify:CR=1 FL=1